MKCPRCGKDNPADVHTCFPLALKLADDIENRLYDVVFDQVIAELRRLYEEVEGTAQRNRDIYKQLDKAEAEIDRLYKAAQPQPDHLRDATEKVDCPRCGHCCPDDTELRQLREQNLMLDAEAAKDEALLRQALKALVDAHVRVEHKQNVAMREAAIAALRERLKA
jgi:hypothetical protein